MKQAHEKVRKTTPYTILSAIGLISDPREGEGERSATARDTERDRERATRRVGKETEWGGVRVKGSGLHFENFGGILWLRI